MLRFKFIPSLVKNEKEPQKSVSGKLLYEKKRKKDDVFPTDSGDVSIEMKRTDVETVRKTLAYIAEVFA